MHNIGRERVEVEREREIERYRQRLLGFGGSGERVKKENSIMKSKENILFNLQEGLIRIKRLK